MDQSFFAYLRQLELMAFFSGYPLIYVFTVFFAGKQPAANSLGQRLLLLLPFAYALAGTLYFGLQLKNLYPDYSFEHIKLSIQQPWLIGWALLSLLFWIPALAKKRSLSLIHSFLFFFFLVKDLVLKLTTPAAGNDIIKNDMKIYTISLLVNAAALLFMVLISFLVTSITKKERR